MVVRHFAFGNVGRDKNTRKSSHRIDLNALESLRDKLPDEKSAVFLCEINEGDDNNELRLAIKNVFKGWHVYGKTTREPILLSPDNPVAKSTVFWVNNSAVPRWSPRRSVLVVNLKDEPHSLMTCHPAAGANGQGERPALVRPHLQTSWDATMIKRRQIKERLFERGRNITELSDLNVYDLTTRGKLPRERTVFHDATDWGIIMPAFGYLPEFKYKGSVDFDIDSHDGHIMYGRYTEIEK